MQMSNQQIATELLEQLEETFEQVKGIYLDRGTSLMETLAALSAAEASKPITRDGTSIAGQVTHLRFYLNVMNDYMAGKKSPNLDWKQSWLVKTVTESEWQKLRADLKDDYVSLRAEWQSKSDWSAEDQLGGAIAVLVHTAYHLGAIRQILHVAKK